MSVNLTSSKSAVVTDGFGVSHIAWVDNGVIRHAVYNSNSETWENAVAIAAAGTQPICNLRIIASVLEHNEVRHMKLRNGDWVPHVLCSIAVRAKKGMLTTIWQDVEDDMTKSPSRRYSGMNHIAADPPDVIKTNPALCYEMANNVPRSQIGRSTFSYSRLVKQICRCECDLLDVDISNAQAVLMARAHPGQFPALEEYVHNRGSVLSMAVHYIKQSYQGVVDMDVAKSLFIVRMNCGSEHSWFTSHNLRRIGEPIFFAWEFARDFVSCMKAVVKREIEAHAAEYGRCVERCLGTDKSPETSLMRRLSNKREREVIDLAIKSLNLKVVDYQHDGFAIHGSAVMSADKLQQDLRAATGIAFTVKSYPDRTQLMGIIKEQTGSLTKSSAVDGRTFANSLAVCLPILGLVQGSRHCDTHFGLVMAGLVDDHIYQNCYGELEVFRGGAWVTEPNQCPSTPTPSRSTCRSSGAASTSMSPTASSSKCCPGPWTTPTTETS